MYFRICIHMHVQLLVYPMNICSAHSGVTAIICEFIKNINVRPFYSDTSGTVSAMCVCVCACCMCVHVYVTMLYLHSNHSTHVSNCNVWQREGECAVHMKVLIRATSELSEGTQSSI